MTSFLLIVSSILFTQSSKLELFGQMHDNSISYLIMVKQDISKNTMDVHVVQFSRTVFICISGVLH